VYFAPTLELICEKLKVAPDVAGITFLAFGNGAPDVFSTIAAFSAGDAASGADIGTCSYAG
jgi:sodium/potassium/calcium exchanger 6